MATGADLVASIVAGGTEPMPTDATGKGPAVDRYLPIDVPEHESTSEAAPDVSSASDPSTASVASVALVADTVLARPTTEPAASLAHARGVAHPNAASATAASDAPVAQATTALHRSDIPTAVGHPSFPTHIAAEISLLGAAGVERAEIQLQPRELGPVRVELTLSGETARVAFSAAQPETRNAIEQSLPILKDLLAERGLTLGQASVSDGRTGSGSQEGAPTPSGEAARAGSGAAANERSFAGDGPRTTLRRTLLDVYA
ncbi:MAG: flagellar hook-length control protein FliK [Burkholderiaceae bacterium]|nr:flagellar hook-length control protein FliK [Burkholderiaceae bacterium]